MAGTKEEEEGRKCFI